MPNPNRTKFIPVSNVHQVRLPPPVVEQAPVKPATVPAPAKSTRAKNTDKE